MRRMIPDNQWNNVKSNVEALIGGLSTDEASTKKIYFHPIFLEGSNFRLAFVILSQKDTAYENWSVVVADVRTWISTSRPYINLISHGGIIDGTDVLIPSAVTINNSSVVAYGVKTDGTKAQIDFTTLNITTFVDAVNAIN